MKIKVKLHFPVVDTIPRSVKPNYVVPTNVLYVIDRFNFRFIEVVLYRILNVL